MTGLTVLVLALASSVAGAFTSPRRAFKTTSIKVRPPRVAPLSMGLTFNPDRMRDTMTLTNAMFSMYDILHNNHPPNNAVTNETLRAHFTSCAVEYNTSKTLRLYNDETSTAAISAVVKEATSMKDKLIGEESAAEAAEIAAAAATVAFTCFSWCPGVNLGLEAAALILYTTATGLELAADSYEGTVIEYISNMNAHIVTQPGMGVIKEWQDAVQANGAYYPVLELGLTDDAQRAMMQAIPMGILKNNTGYIDADGFAKYIDGVGNFIYNNQNIVMQYEHLLASIDNTTTLEEYQQAKLTIDHMLPPGVSEHVDMALDFITAAAAMKSFKEWRAARSVVSMDVEMPYTNEDGELGEGTAATEESFLTEVSTVGAAVGVIGSVGILVMDTLQIIDTAHLDERLTAAIANCKGNLTNYYQEITASVPTASELLIAPKTQKPRHGLVSLVRRVFNRKTLQTV